MVSSADRNGVSSADRNGIDIYIYIYIYIYSYSYRYRKLIYKVKHYLIDFMQLISEYLSNISKV